MRLRTTLAKHSMTSSVTIRLLSGESRQIDGLRSGDLFRTLHEKIAAELNLLVIEVCVCHGNCNLSVEDHSRTLRDLGLLEGAGGRDVAVLRIPRLTPDVLQGDWMNSKGTRIEVSGLSANVAGLVTEEVKVDSDDTVIGIGDHLTVKGPGSHDVVTFENDHWWRVREDTDDFLVILRTVGGTARSIESLRSSDTLSALRECAVLELADVLDLDIRKGHVCIHWLTGDYRGSGPSGLLHEGFDHLTLCDLGMKSGISVLCTRD